MGRVIPIAQKKRQKNSELMLEGSSPYVFLNWREENRMIPSKLVQKSMIIKFHLIKVLALWKKAAIEYFSFFFAKKETTSKRIEINTNIASDVNGFQ